MNRIPIVLKSEFKRRVTSKGFILTTLLGPIGILVFFGIIILISAEAVDSDSRTIAVVDDTNVLLEHMLNLQSVDHRFTPVDAPLDTIRAQTLAGVYDGYLHLPAGLLTDEASPEYYSPEGGGFSLANDLEYRIGHALRQHRIGEHNLSPEVLKSLDTNVSLGLMKLTDDGEEAGASWVYSALGGFMGFLIYMTMLIYGTVVLYGVIEEKSTRVVEIMISSIRPFELLMGKVLGIGLMGLVQLTVWALLMMGGLALAGVVAGMFLDPSTLGVPATASSQELLAAADITLPNVSVDVFVWFVLFFLVGYLLYAGLFAAVGSMVEQQQDTQGLLLPVMMPIIVSIMFISPVLENPHSSLAVILSLIPFTAPVPMVVRLAVTEVPLWEVLLSFSLLCAGFVATIWVSSRIYRVGILMYGKKATLKDLIRWFRYA